MAFLVILLLVVIVAVLLLTTSEKIEVKQSLELEHNSMAADNPNYDPYYQDYNSELEPVDVYNTYKEEKMAEVVKKVDCGCGR